MLAPDITTERHGGYSAVIICHDFMCFTILLQLAVEAHDNGASASALAEPFGGQYVYRTALTLKRDCLYICRF